MPKYIYEFGGHMEDHGLHGMEHVGTESYEYEVERSDVIEALKELVQNDYTVPKEYKEDIEPFIETHFDQLVEDYDDYLKDHFEHEARQQYEYDVELSKNPDAYYGVSRND